MLSENLINLAQNYKPAPRVRYNSENFGFIVGFPDGNIVLAKPSAVQILNNDTNYEEIIPHLLTDLEVPEGFHLNTPPLVWIELTRKCNLTCPHCYIDAGRKRQSELPTERWISLLDEMSEMGVWAVAFTGGEPTLHPDFTKIVNHARDRDLLVGIATHGMFLSDELLSSIPTEGVIISVSIDDLHVGRQGHNAPSKLAKESILRAQRHGFLTNVMSNTHKKNIHGLADLMGWAKTNGVSLRSVPMSPIGRGKRNSNLENTVEDVDKAAKFWIDECEWEHEYHTQAGLCVGAIFNYGLTLSYMTQRCSSGRFLCYVAADGTLFPCTMCAGENIFSPGSIRSSSFPSAWRQNWPIRENSWKDFESACHACPINKPEYYCSARCPAMSFARNNSFNECGASPFEIASTIRRTELLSVTESGKTSNIPISELSSSKAP